jgi:hypothetical protein
VRVRVVLLSLGIIPFSEQNTARKQKRISIRISDITISFQVIGQKEMRWILNKTTEIMSGRWGNLSGTANRLRAWRSGVRILVDAINFSLLQRYHPASYSVGTGDKAAEAWSRPLTYIYCRGYEWVELCLHSPYKPSWSGRG